ncbi:hypothetical protein E2562_030906 [Oryza meyeriana var. granulata]|uniref:Secreted protein n=1 Tax=Oryza meyeriana var. granulata TaxID=110450 RepID=A0A6G1E6T3_9ORYZ|nr:hypothetical protein E2562_030906 [Oryza meyeriana var. granulata]
MALGCLMWMATVTGRCSCGRSGEGMCWDGGAGEGNSISNSLRGSDAQEELTAASRRSSHAAALEMELRARAQRHREWSSRRWRGGAHT